MRMNSNSSSGKTSPAPPDLVAVSLAAPRVHSPRPPAHLFTPPASAHLRARARALGGETSAPGEWGGACSAACVLSAQHRVIARKRSQREKLRIPGPCPPRNEMYFGESV